MMAARWPLASFVVTRLAAAVLIAGGIVFVWPTRYRYDRMQLLGEVTPGPVYPVRIDRFTGEAEILMPEMVVDGRHQMKLAWVGQTGEVVPPTIVAALREHAVIETTPLPYAQIVNVTDWRITRLRWDVTSAEGAGPGAARTRPIEQSVFIEPRALASVYLDLGRFGRNASITLAAAWGLPPGAR